MPHPACSFIFALIANLATSCAPAPITETLRAGEEAIFAAELAAQQQTPALYAPACEASHAQTLCRAAIEQNKATLQNTLTQFIPAPIPAPPPPKQTPTPLQEIISAPPPEIISAPIAEPAPRQPILPAETLEPVFAPELAALIEIEIETAPFIFELASAATKLPVQSDALPDSLTPPAPEEPAETEEIPAVQLVALAEINPPAPEEIPAKQADTHPQPPETIEPPPTNPNQEWWLLTKSEPLHHQIARWAEIAGWNLVWKSEYEYPIEASAGFAGTFPEAVEKAVYALKNVYPPIHVTFYQNRVAVVENPDGHY